MIPMDGMAYRRLNDIQPGNLVYYVEGQAAPVLDLSTGELQSIGDQEFTFITEWSIGLADTSGLFCRLVTYPADFRAAGT